MSNNQMMKTIERREQTPIESTSLIREEKPTINSNRSMFFSFISLILSIYISPFFGFLFSVLAIYYAFAALTAGEKKLNMILSLLLSAASMFVSVIFNPADKQISKCSSIIFLPKTLP